MFGALLLFAARARTEEPARNEHRVDFEAEEVELAGAESELSLRGDVVVRSERFQLTADRVTLSRSSRGVHVEGSGRLAFCRCKAPPLTLGFSAADLAPPTDVLLEHATLRVFGLPVFYSPYLWLRAPTRVGLFPPSIEYRGMEGVFLTTGAHIPFRQGKEAEPEGVLDVGVGAYLAGGVRTTLNTWGDFGQAELGWDYFEGSVFWGRAEVATTLSEGKATLAGSLRALRGARAFSQPSRVKDVALRMDRARIGVARLDGPLVALSGVASAPRGVLMRERPAMGPLFELGQNFAIGERTSLDFLLESEALYADSGPVNTLNLRAGLASSPATGPWLTDVWLRARGRVLASEDGNYQSFDGESRARLALPLARRFGAMVHRVEPVVEGALGVRRARADSLQDGFDAGGFAERGTLLGGIESALGSPGQAMDLRIMGGVSGRLAAPDGVVATRVRAGFSPLVLDTEARAIPLTRAVEAAVRAWTGARGVVELGLYAQARRGATEPLRRLFANDFTRPDVPWLRVEGASAGGLVRVPLGLGLSSEGGLDYDVTRERLLGGSAALAYRHPCGCLGAGLSGWKRLGRDDFDLALRVDLVP